MNNFDHMAEVQHVNDHFYTTEATGSDIIRLGQMNAIAEMARQQRIANLIAFVASVQSGVTTVLPSNTVMRRAEMAGAQIIEGLDLS